MHTNAIQKAAVCMMAAALLAVAVGQPGDSSVEPPKAVKFTLIADGKTRTISTSAETLGQALRELNIRVGEKDKVFPDPDTRIYPNMKSRIIRIRFEDKTVRELIAPQTVRQVVTSLRPGHARVASEGEDGLQNVTYRLQYADGKRVNKERIEAQVLKDAEPRVVHVGKGSVLPSRGFNSRKVMVMQATAYDPGPKSCGPYADGRTSTGMKAGKGVVAVDPKVIPLGTKLYIEGYGFAVAGDVGGAIKGKRIDLGHDTYRQAIRFGRRPVVVHVLNE